MRNLTVIGVALILYALLGAIFGLMALGVGFMSDPARTIYGHLILLVPFAPSGIVIGYFARSHPFILASLLALAGLVAFLTLAPGPVPFFFREQSGLWIIAAQATYQAALYMLTCIAAAWIGARLRGVRNTGVQVA